MKRFIMPAIVVTLFSAVPAIAHNKPFQNSQQYAGGSVLASLAPNKIGIQIAQADRATRQVQNQLVELERAALKSGARRTHEPFIGDLGNGGEDNITLNLRRGISYTIFGVCDNDCNDIDLGLYDDNGKLVSSDIQRGDIPVVKVSPRWNARFTVRVVMARCSNAPCRYGIASFGR